jgi:hypothetical protein
MTKQTTNKFSLGAVASRADCPGGGHASGSNLTVRFSLAEACASLRNARANEYLIECRQAQ